MTEIRLKCDLELRPNVRISQVSECKGDVVLNGMSYKVRSFEISHRIPHSHDCPTVTVTLELIEE